MADELTFTSECVAKYLTANGGKVSNHELVKHFKRFLNGPSSHPNARAIFKDYVNSVATIKQEDGVKYVVLKKRTYEEKNKNSDSSERKREETICEAKKSRLNEDLETISNSEKSSSYGISHSNSSPSVLGSSAIEPIIQVTSPILWSSDLPPGFVPQPPPRRKHSMKGKENRSAKFEASLQKINGEKDIMASPSKEEIREVVSPGNVKQKAHFLNKMASEQDISKSTHNRRRDDKNGDFDDMCSVSSLDPRRKEWIIKAAQCDYHELVRLLREEPKLVNVTDHHKYTALHWAAKHGKLDVIKLIAGTHKVDSNVRTSGGYTPLHLAAMFGHEEIMEVLINTYGADPSVRDCSGKRALNYLPKNQAERFLSMFPTLAFPVLLCGKVIGGKADKEPSLVRMGSLNSKVKKTSVLSAGRAITRMKSWGSADNIQDRAVNLMPPPKTFPKKKKTRKHADIIGISENWRGRSPDSDSDSATGNAS